jgi:3-oxoadipate enol-lactonase
VPMIRVGDIDVHYSIQGEGPWLTLAHPLAGDLSLWAPQMRVLTERFRVLRYDVRGHGASGASAAPYSLELLARDAGSLLDQLGITRTHWIGLSMGGMIAQQLALERPGLLDRIVLADSTARRPADAAAVWDARIQQARQNGVASIAKGTLERWFTAPFREREAVALAWVSDVIARTSVEGYCGCCAAIARIDLLDRLREIRSPALIMAGEHDHSTPPAMSELMSRHWPGSQYYIIPDAAHIANIEQADDFNDRVMRFLTGPAP